MTHVFESDYRDSFYNKIGEYLIKHGEVGATEVEHFCDIPSKSDTITPNIIDKMGYRIAQIAYFEDTDEVDVYMLDCYDNGFFASIYDLDDDTMHEIVDYFEDKVF